MSYEHPVEHPNSLRIAKRSLTVMAPSPSTSSGHPMIMEASMKIVWVSVAVFPQSSIAVKVLKTSYAKGHGPPMISTSVTIFT